MRRVTPKFKFVLDILILFFPTQRFNLSYTVEDRMHRAILYSSRILLYFVFELRRCVELSNSKLHEGV